jgi:hypothetical protein
LRQIAVSEPDEIELSENVSTSKILYVNTSDD